MCSCSHQLNHTNNHPNKRTHACIHYLRGLLGQRRGLRLELRAPDRVHRRHEVGRVGQLRVGSNGCSKKRGQFDKGDEKQSNYCHDFLGSVSTKISLLIVDPNFLLSEKKRMVCYP
jgi:hypothetical protein